MADCIRSSKGDISIHSLHTEGDFVHFSVSISFHPFQSTPSTRRETSHIDIVAFLDGISIHSLHTEGDPLPSP